MGIRKNTGFVIAILAFLAFIIIQFSPLWISLDYDKIDTPCPLHAMRAAHKENETIRHHPPRHHEHHAAASHITQVTPDEKRDKQDKEENKEQEKPWACPYCSVREAAFIPVDDIRFVSLQRQIVAVRYFNNSISEPAKIRAIRAYQSRAPPRFS